MLAVCVDDEKLVLNMVVTLCDKMPLITKTVGFLDPYEALAWLEKHDADIAVLDIDMPGINGIELAIRIKKLRPETQIVFLTGYEQYVTDAFKLHASGYILKPINQKQLAAEIEFALSGGRRHDSHQNGKNHIEAKTFGTFELLVDGVPVKFNRSMCKELLAFLIDRHGGSVSRPTIYAAMWEDGLYDRAKQKYLDTIIRDLRTTLSGYGVGDILEVDRGNLRVVTEKLDCDLYRMLDGNVDTINEFRGDYMTGYKWASLDETFLMRCIIHRQGAPPS